MADRPLETVADVVLLEKSHKLGETTIVSGGNIDVFEEACDPLHQQL